MRERLHITVQNGFQLSSESAPWGMNSEASPFIAQLCDLGHECLACFLRISGR
jgi:hypothetical protein